MIPDTIPIPDFDEALAREQAQRPDDPYAPFRAMINAVHTMLLARSVAGAMSAQALAALEDRLADVEMIAKNDRQRLDEHLQAHEAGK